MEKMKKAENEIVASVKEASEILRGERPPSRAWKVEKSKDGTWTRKALDPAAIQARNKARREAKENFFEAT